MKKVTNKIMWIFAMGQLGWAILSGIVVNWLVYFYQPVEELIAAGHKVYISQGTAIFGIFTLIGAISAAGRIADAITDPLIASASDRSAHPKGRRIPFLRASAAPFALVTVLIFMPPVAKVGGLNNFWLVTMVFLFYLFMTMYCTPYTAMIPELGKSQEDKINISTFISITFIVGTALAYGAPFIWDIFIAQGMERISAIQLTFGILAVIALIFMMIPALFIRERDYILSEPSKSKAFESLLKTFHNKHFRVFVLSDALYWIALTIFQTGLPFFVVRLLKLEESMITVLFLVMTLTSFLFYVPVNIIAKRIGKKKLVMSAFVLFALAFSFTALSGLIPIPAVLHGFLIAVMAAIPMAILGILPQAMVADIAQYDRMMTHESREGMFFAARTFVFKLGQSLAMILFTSLATIGQSSGFGYRLALLGALILSILGAVVLIFYKEDEILKGIEPLKIEA